MKYGQTCLQVFLGTPVMYQCWSCVCLRTVPGMGREEKALLSMFHDMGPGYQTQVAPWSSALASHDTCNNI